MSEVKQVKVDNWGIFFLQRLKHFFNRTDYCDLTLQFQDNAQLKVHRLVLSACTEYFELLERTCEMYEDCLVMPDDLQADVVVPIINFMYTGQLEFRMDLLERLYQTSLVMNMPVLTKLLDAHRSHKIHKEPSYSHTTYSNTKRYPKSYEKHFSMPSSSHTTNNKRSYGKAFDNDLSFRKYRKQGTNKSDFDMNSIDLSPHTLDLPTHTSKKQIDSDPRPTRYELPEELEAENMFDNSFTNISYTSKPLMVHPETIKRYPSKRTGIFEDPSTSKRFVHGQSTMDIVECKKISANDRIFEDDPSDSICDDQDAYAQSMLNIKNEARDSNQLFDQILDGGPKVTIETKDTKQSNNLDHAKIISEVLKKYPHLVKSNKNIKLKILNTPTKKKSRPVNSLEEEKEVKQKTKAATATPDYAYESKVLDSKEAAKLIALGAENINGPWICLICGAPGKAIHFSSYYKFRRHLVEVHNEKPVPTICEYCGQKSLKRNYLLHHLYTKHGVEPPPQYHFPKCNICNYVALTEGYLIKHKLSHPDKHTFRCNVCFSMFKTSNQLLSHIQKTGHKYSADKKANLQCIYCFKTFFREANLYAHLRTNHKESARNDGIIDISDDEKPEVKENKVIMKTPPKQEYNMKYEVPVTYDNEYDFDADIQYQIQQQPDGNIQVVTKKPRVLLPTVKHKILNPGFGAATNKMVQKTHSVTSTSNKHDEFTPNTNSSVDTSPEQYVMIDNDEYVVKDNHLIPKMEKTIGRENYPMSDIIHTEIDDSVTNIIPSSSVEFTNIQTTNSEHHKMIINKPNTLDQPIQIVVSNEEEYKALMSSNHSIIFEDGDTNKTLTVLTAPHDNHTIDLENTQSNEMMIIPENYPLNVTDTVATSNSNIVVVYSHPVDGQNKEYQLITSENLQAQFVTSTAILTQNYETVTTSATIMNSHELNTPVEDSWSNNIPHNIASNQELEVPVRSNQVTITPIESQEGTIANLEEVQLPPIQTQSEQIHPSAEIIQTEALEIHPCTNINITDTQEIHPCTNENQTDIQEIHPCADIISVDTVEMHSCANVNQTDAEEVHPCRNQPITDVITESHNIDNLSENNTVINGVQSDVMETSETVFVETVVSLPVTNSDVEGSNSIINASHISDQHIEEVNGVNEIVTQDDIQLENIPVAHEEEAATSKQTLDDAKFIENDSTEDSSESETIQNIAKAVQLSAPVTSATVNTETHMAIINDATHIEETTTVQVNEQIQNLTSEWSDDDIESSNPEETSQEANSTKDVVKSDVMETDSQSELEESVENIQQEMEKQLTRGEQQQTASRSKLDLLSELENVADPSQQDAILEESLESDNNVIVLHESHKTPMKIASLLNDWEDSQEAEGENKEDVELNNEKNNQMEDMQSNDTVEITEKEVNDNDPDTQIEKSKPKAEENIEKLVSDWVEDDEDEVTENKVN